MLHSGVFLRRFVDCICGCAGSSLHVGFSLVVGCFSPPRPLSRSSGSKAHGRSSGGSRGRAQARQVWCAGLLAPQHVGSSQAWDRTCVSCISKRTLPLNHQGSLCYRNSVFINHLKCFPEDFLRARGPASPTPLLSPGGLRQFATLYLEHGIPCKCVIWGESDNFSQFAILVSDNLHSQKISPPAQLSPSPQQAWLVFTGKAHLNFSFPCEF